MSIIAKSRRSRSNHTPYDIEDKEGLRKLKKRISALARDMNKTQDKDKKAYKEACLKFIAITLYQQKKPNNPTVKAVWACLMKHIEKPTQEELASEAENLFTDPNAEKADNKTNRNKTNYKDNITYALSTLIKTDKKPTEKELNNPRRLARVVKEHEATIVEHAHRRVELFFLLCVAIYNKKKEIKLTHTGTQHGKGTEGFRHVGAHSSLFTGIKPGILKGTQLAEALNSTVEVPDCVNKFDSICEGNNSRTVGLRQKLLPTLQKVSSGIITPIEAMAFFFSNMQDFFNGKGVENSKAATPRTPSRVKQYIRRQQKKGTFSWTDSSGKAPSVEALAAWTRSSYSAASFFLAKPEMAEACFARQQTEILRSKPL